MEILLNVVGNSNCHNSGYYCTDFDVVVVALLHFIVLVLVDAGVVVQPRCLGRLLLLPPQPRHLPLEHDELPAHTVVIALLSFFACLLPNNQKVSL